MITSAFLVTSCFTVVFISIERYRLIVQNKVWDNKGLMIVFGIIYFFCALWILLIHLLTMNMGPIELQYCKTSTDPSKKTAMNIGIGYFFNVMVTLCAMVVPFCYWRIFSHAILTDRFKNMFNSTKTGTQVSSSAVGSDSTNDTAAASRSSGTILKSQKADREKGEDATVDRPRLNTARTITGADQKKKKPSLFQVRLTQRLLVYILIFYFSFMGTIVQNWQGSVSTTLFETWVYYFLGISRPISILLNSITALTIDPKFKLDFKQISQKIFKR